MNGKVLLDGYRVVIGDEPTFVRKCVDDLLTYVPSSGDGDITILVGKAADAELPDDPQSYLLSIQPSTVIATGKDPQGTKYALIDLIRSIQWDGSRAWIPADLNVVGKPHFGLRGMYAHLHWQYNHPYALRSWSLDDWKRYVDFLAYMKINLFQIWTMAALCPNPLSVGDEAYLAKYHAIVEYAREWGMEVWPGECANNVAESDFGVPIEQREYFQAEVLKNPADPDHFGDIMDNRGNMYRLVNNGDGYWIIDSDPGNWRGSPASELADIFAGNRELIDCHANPAAKLVYWMWQGWGTGTPQENWRRVIEGLSEKVHEPWWLTPCNDQHLALVSEMGYLGKSVFFPYGVIEPEPSNPFTHVKFAELAVTLSLALRYPGLAGIMGNAQTPFAQLPNILYFAECAWDPQTSEMSDGDILRRLGQFLFPQIADQLAEGWLALSREGSDQAFAIGRTLESIEIGMPGPGGRFLPETVVRDLALLLRIHGFAEKVREEDSDSVFGYLSGVLEWQARTGFHGCRVNGVDFSGGGTLLYGRDFNTVCQIVRAKVELAEPLANRLMKAGFSESTSKRAVFELFGV